MKNIIPLLFILLAPALRAQYSIQYEGDTEPNQCTGTILASVGSAETGPFTIELFLETENGLSLTAIKFNVTSIANFSNLCEGDYKVVFTDDFGCESELPAKIEGCNDISLRNAPESYVTHSTDCNSPNGAVGIITQSSFNGGTGYITWEWSGGTVGPQGIYDLAPGTYSLTATDEEGCEGIFSFEVAGEELWLQGNALPTCAGQSNGAINVGATFSEGGPITFSWSNGATSEKIDELAPGVYTVTATHSPSGCTASQSWAIAALPDLGNLTLVAEAEPSCPGQNTGSIATTVSGGTGSYSYAWSSNGFGAQSSYLPAKEYTITVTDYCGNVAVEQIEVGEFDEPKLSVETWNDCSGDGTGGIIIGQLGEGNFNTGVYSFFLNSEPFSVPFGYTSKDLEVGNYLLEVVSINGCSKSFDIRINSESNNTQAIEINLTSPEDINCHGSPFLAPIVSGGIPEYKYVWRDYNTNVIVSFDSKLDQSFVPGIYKLSVSDECGNIDNFPVYDFTCTCDRQFALAATGATPCFWPYELKINSLLLYTDLTPGYYDFEWSFDGENGSNLDASFTKFLNGSTEWENRQKTYWNSGTKKITYKDPRGCVDEVSFEVSGQTDDNVANITAFATGIHTDLYELRPNLFPPDFEDEFLVQTGCGVFETCGDNYNDQQSTVLLNFMPFAGDHPDPCQRGGTLRCGLDSENEEAKLNVPENSIATYFVDTDGNCGCLFPPTLFPEENFIHPFYVEFPCDQLVGDTSSQGETINIIDPELCDCDMCFWNSVDVPECSYTVTCASTMEIITTVTIGMNEWNMCKVEGDVDHDGNMDNWAVYVSCPLDDCVRNYYDGGLYVESDPLAEFPNWEELPVCETCGGSAIVDVGNHEIGEDLFSLNDSLDTDKFSVSSNSLNNNSSKILIFPNPIGLNQKTINIKGDLVNRITQVELFGVAGLQNEILRLKTLDENNGQVNIGRNLNPGIYLIRLTLKDGNFIIHKLVVI